ncbi:hypothetical protein H70357_07925 [Paenibacillus sp. FSL H7-0357]|uniref:hypothetical protein n=1 Tax=Paenibacillus sp. FSL H7-0357 TaxID=1536774 RepID=UPI0004F899EA|nr:hypothetical protein [Paenibacillus sp. FSL H7-0357]AIQ16604.1 hypothetical protein H70357_07925 [Paenibacillus sp. FSL H7-0357]
MIPERMREILVGAVKAAEQSTLKDIALVDLSGEENITIDLLKAIKILCLQAFEKHKDNSGRFNYEVTAREFPKRTMEPMVSADFAISLRKYDVWSGTEHLEKVKSVLVQAKLPESSDYKRLIKQINDMGQISDESYVAVYDFTGVYIVKSTDVIESGYRVKNVTVDKRLSLGDFFSDIFICHRGKVGFGC